MVCLACQQAWPCPSVTWAADWTLVARRLGLLKECDIQISDDIAVTIERWHRNGLALAAAAAV